jgi:flagellar biosynthesis regulator FlaF
MSIIRLSIFIVTSCKKIQREQEKYNKLIVFFAIF